MLEHIYIYIRIRVKCILCTRRVYNNNIRVTMVDVLSRPKSYRISRGTAHRPPCTGTDAADLAASVVEPAACVIRVRGRQDSRLP